MSKCACGSSKDFAKCCKPFLMGKAVPKTAEELMRSRYVAYTKANIDYVVATQAKTAAVGFDAKDAAGWAAQVQWLRLQVKRVDSMPNNEGLVEFVASYRAHGQVRKIHEISRFELIRGLWYYTGQFVEQTEESTS